MAREGAGEGEEEGEGEQGGGGRERSLEANRKSRRTKQREGDTTREKGVIERRV